MQCDKYELFDYVGLILGSAYSLMLRLFRNQYKWSCGDTDNIQLRRLMKIYDETLEDIDKKKELMDNAR